MGFANDPQVNEHHELGSVRELDAVLEPLWSWRNTSSG
jgi:hypothetical protein